MTDLTPAPLPPIEPARFREGMSRVPGAVHLVATDGPAGLGGFTATAVTSVADTPPMLLVCVNGANQSCRQLVENGVFCVSALAAEDEALAGVFAGRTGVHGPGKFASGAWAPLATGAPALASALAAFDCRVVDMRPAATHLVIFGEVVGISVGPHRPALVYRERAFHRI